MKRESIASFQVMGPACRTCNADEFDPQGGRIGPLWQRFAASGLATAANHSVSQPSEVFGVYFDYADRHLAEYSVLAGVKLLEGAAPAQAEESALEHRRVLIPASDYLVFDCQGPMPAALIDGWRKVWQYFEQPDAEARAYEHDFERYLGPESVQICIGLRR
ncbi:GyrI-like domain-containing protein [Paucibacter sp. AS339]|uniref:GyrI-like domain-containing protein n=1 Tax=Paucibacter hankyongi TaxID=3133434 RepID=UPI0030AAF4E8